MAQVNRVPKIEDLHAKRDEILRVARTLGAENVRVFGSVARDEADLTSDIDLLVDVIADVRGFAYFGLLEDLRRALSELLDRDVHIVDSSNLQRIEPQVLRDAILL